MPQATNELLLGLGQDRLCSKSVQGSEICLRAPILPLYCPAKSPPGRVAAVWWFWVRLVVAPATGSGRRRPGLGRLPTPPPPRGERRAAHLSPGGAASSAAGGRPDDLARREPETERLGTEPGNTRRPGIMPAGRHAHRGRQSAAACGADFAAAAPPS